MSRKLRKGIAVAAIVLAVGAVVSSVISGRVGHPPGSATEVAARLGCQGYRDDPFIGFGEREIFTLPLPGSATQRARFRKMTPEELRSTFQEGACLFEGRHMRIYWSSGQGAAATYLFHLGPRPRHLDRFLIGQEWVAHCATAAQCRDAQSRLGGQLASGVPALSRPGRAARR